MRGVGQACAKAPGQVSLFLPVHLRGSPNPLQSARGPRPSGGFPTPEIPNEDPRREDMADPFRGTV